MLIFILIKLNILRYKGFKAVILSGKKKAALNPILWLNCYLYARIFINNICIYL